MQESQRLVCSKGHNATNQIRMIFELAGETREALYVCRIATNRSSLVTTRRRQHRQTARHTHNRVVLPPRFPLLFQSSFGDAAHPQGRLPARGLSNLDICAGKSRARSVAALQYDRGYRGKISHLERQPMAPPIAQRSVRGHGGSFYRKPVGVCVSSPARKRSIVIHQLLLSAILAHIAGTQAALLDHLRARRARSASSTTF